MFWNDRRFKFIIAALGPLIIFLAVAALEAAPTKKKKKGVKSPAAKRRVVKPTPSPSPTPTPTPAPDTVEQKLIDANIEVSETIDEVMEDVDLFLTGRRVSRKRNETYVRLENSTFFKEYDSARNETSINANIRLPNFEEYWQLKFSSYDESRESRNANTGYTRRAPRERNYGASVGLFRKLGGVRTSFQPRVELRDPLKVSHSLAFDSVADYKWMRISPRFELFAHADRGVGLFQALNFWFEVSKVFSLNLINQGEYEEKIHKYTVTNGISVGQTLSEKQFISYNLFFVSHNRPNYHLQSYTPSISWSEVLYKRILDYQITPYIEFDELKSYTGVPGLTFDINLTF